jgi:hypothetical protein
MKVWTLCLAVLATAAITFAGAPSFTYNKIVDYTPHPSAGNCYGAAARPLGGMVMVDGYDDAVFRIAFPLTTDGDTDNAANTWNVNGSAEFTRPFTTGESFQGICYDGAAYYACGITGTGSSFLIRVTDSGNDANKWAGQQLTLSADGFYSGPTAVGLNTIVIPNFNTGEIQFFSISGANATALGSVANPNAAGFKTTQAYYYDSGTTKYIFVYMANDTTARRIDVFTTDGTVAGTAYAGTFCQGVPSTMIVVGHYKQKFANLAVDPVRKVLVAAANLNNTGGNNGFDAFNIDTVVTNGSAVPYLENRDATFNAHATTRNVAGFAFFSAGGSDYLGITHANRLSIFNVTTTSAVDDWSLFE